MSRGDDDASSFCIREERKTTNRVVYVDLVVDIRSGKKKSPCRECLNVRHESFHKDGSISICDCTKRSYMVALFVILKVHVLWYYINLSVVQTSVSYMVQN